MLSKNNILKRNSNFSRLYFAGLTSELGSFVTDTAVMLFVFSLSGNDKSFLGLSRALFLFFFTAGSLLGGPIGVRFSKKNILIYSEVFRIPLVLSLMFLHNTTYVVVANALIGFFTGIYNPSRQALINEVVEEKDIKEANSLFGTTFAILHLAGPFLGATMYGTFHGIREVLTFDILTYIIGIVLLVRIRHLIHTKSYEDQKADSKISKLIFDFKEGYKYVKSRDELFAMFLFIVIMGLCIGVLIPLLYPFIVEVLHRSEKDYGINISLFGLGGVLGGWLSGILNKNFKASHLFYLSIIAEAIIMPIWIRTNNFPLNCFVIFVWGALVFIRIPTQLNYISATVPKEFMSRIHAFLDIAFVVPNITAGIVVAMIGNKLSTYEILNYTSILFIILIGAGSMTKGLKRFLQN